MLDNAVIFQTVCGCAVVTTVGGTAVYAIQKSNFVEEPSETLSEKTDVPDFYYFGHVKTTSNNSPSDELYEKDVKNFKCQWTNNKTVITDEQCEIYKLDNRTNDDNLLEINNITEPLTKVKKTDLSKTGTLLKIKINDEKFNYSLWKEQLEINVISNKTGENNKNYGTLTINYQNVTTNIVGNTNLVIAKIDDVEEEATIATNSTFGCLFHEEKLDLKDCDIFEISDQPKNSEEYTNIKINKLAKITEKSKFTKDKYIVVNLKLEPKNAKNLNYLLQNKKLSVLVKEESEPPKVKRLGGFSILGTLYNVENFEPTSSKTTLLSKIKD